MDFLRLQKPLTWGNEVEINLPLSKSISNRILILNALSKGKIYSLEYSEANDSKILKRILQTPEIEIYDAEDAGTALRFLIAFAACGEKSKIITGTDRMKSRPVLGLCNSLEILGAKIEYLENHGYPPLKVTPPIQGLNGKESILIDDKRSSQFISALMLIAPWVKNGISLRFQKDFPSFSYLELTSDIMKKAGFEVRLNEDSVYIPEQKINPTAIEIETDWSSASYFILFLLTGNWKNMVLKSVSLDSIQKDVEIIEFSKPLGLVVEAKGKDLLMKNSGLTSIGFEMHFDFSNNPDLAMTVILAYALKKIDFTVSGIENLVYKESNRIEALRTELGKIGVSLTQHGNQWKIDSSRLSFPKNIEIQTYKDHRIAMAFSVLSLYTDIQIENPEVVNKSFPNFWEELKLLGLYIH